MLFSDLTPSDAESLWPGFIPAADVSLLIGSGGVGKGILCADIAARVSRGWPNPPYAADDPVIGPDARPTPGYVIMISLEDSSTETVVHRLTAAGADLTRIDDMSRVRRGKVSGNTARARFAIGGNDGGDLGLLRDRIAELGDVRLVVMDPLMALATSTVSFNQQMRLKIMDPLQELAADTGVAILLVHHLTKGGASSYAGGTDMSKITDHVAGSKGLIDAVRMASVVVPSPVNAAINVLMNLKSNQGSVPPVEYAVIARGVSDPDAHVEYRCPPPSAGDPASLERLQRKVLDWLIDAGRPVTAQELVSYTRLAYGIVKQLLKNAEQAGLIEKHRGAWQVPAALGAGPAGQRAVAGARAPADLPDLRAAGQALAARR